MQPDLCPCGLGLGYAHCCGPLHHGATAGSAEALMRSRYSAFVMGLAEYLMASWHVSTRPAQLTLDAELKWLGLTVKTQRASGPDTAIVEFVARSRRGGDKAERLHEISRFVRDDGRWFYLDGELR